MTIANANAITFDQLVLLATTCERMEFRNPLVLAETWSLYTLLAKENPRNQAVDKLLEHMTIILGRTIGALKTKQLPEDVSIRVFLTPKTLNGSQAQVGEWFGTTPERWQDTPEEEENPCAVAEMD